MGTGCPWGPEGTAYGNVQAVDLESARQPVMHMEEGTDQFVAVKRQSTMTDTGCPCGPGGTAEVLSIASTTGVTPSSTIQGGNP